MAGRLIITNGDSAARGIREAGINADVLPWRDVLHEGPAPGGLLLEALSLVRAPFLASAFGKSLAEVGRDFAQRDAVLRGHLAYDEVELWFEHDLYDQLQLLQLLDFFASDGRTEGLSVMQADDYLGTMRAPSLRDHAQTARPVDGAVLEAAKRGWAAFTSSTPEAIAAQSAHEIPAMPYLAAAFRRLLQELPAIGSGLTLTQERIVTALMDQPRPVAAVFGTTQVWEDARFLSDLSFFRQVDDLVFAETPLLEGLPSKSSGLPADVEAPVYVTYAHAELTVTDAGRAAHAGCFDHAVENGIDRWMGGTHLTAASLWRRGSDGGLASSPSAAWPGIAPSHDQGPEPA